MLVCVDLINSLQIAWNLCAYRCYDNAAQVLYYFIGSFKFDNIFLAEKMRKRDLKQVQTYCVCEKKKCINNHDSM